MINISAAAGAVIKWRVGITIKYELYFLEKYIKIPTYIFTELTCTISRLSTGHRITWTFEAGEFKWPCLHYLLMKSDE